MPTVAKCVCSECITTKSSKTKTSGGIGRTSGSIGRCEHMYMADTYKKNNVGKLAGGLTGAAISLHNLFNPKGGYAQFCKEVTKYMETPKEKAAMKVSSAIGGAIGAGILTGLGVLLGGSIDKAVEKAKATKAQKDLADLEINRKID